MDEARFASIRAAFGTPGTFHGRTNRNRAVGEFETFSPAAESYASGWPSRPPRRLTASEGFSLVRYHHASEEVRRHVEMLGMDQDDTVPPYPQITARFGILDPEGRPQMLLQALLGTDGNGPKLCLVHAAKECAVPPSAMLVFLNHLDLPPSHRTDAGRKLADLCDVRYGEAGWETSPSRRLVAVTYKRVARGGTPPLTDRMEVVVLPSPGHDLDHPDPKTADRANDHYRLAAANVLALSPQGAPRPGFSGWYDDPEAAPRSFKVLDDSFDAEIERLDVLTGIVDAEMARRLAEDIEDPAGPADLRRMNEAVDAELARRREAAVVPAMPGIGI